MVGRASTLSQSVLDLLLRSLTIGRDPDNSPRERAALRRRRRSNRPGNSQAEGPRGKMGDSGERSAARKGSVGPPKGVSPASCCRPRRGRCGMKSLRFRTEGARQKEEKCLLRAVRPFENRQERWPHGREPAEDSSACAARAPGRAHGAVRRLRNAGPVSARYREGASPYTRIRRSFRRLPHGAGVARRAGLRNRRPGAGAPRARRRARPGARAAALYPAYES